ncbi:hypothetical protein INR49_002086 [Caranx melampygus]|nr:hypothetical protein INR49_002086 [Caranx melampygus]
MESCVDLHTQLASIMEVLANAAVAEICQLVDDGFASLRLEISRSHRENLALRSRLRLMEVRAGERARRGPYRLWWSPAPGEVVEVMQQPVDPEVSEIKREELEEKDPQSAASSNIGPHSPPHSPAAQSIDPLSAGAEISRDSVSCRFGRLESPQQEEKEGARETRASCQYPPVEQSHRAAPRGPSRGSTGEDEHVVDLRDSVPAESSRSTVAVTVEEAPLMKALDTGVKGLCGAAADWRGEAVRLETESSWSEAFRARNAVTGTECVSDSRGINSNNTKNEVAALDTNSLDFDDLFSSPEVAQSLTAPHKHFTDTTGATGMDESLSSSSSFPFLSSRSSFGNSSTTGCFSGSSISRATSDSSFKNDKE